MTDIEPTEPLPTVVTATQSFATRMPTQRAADVIGRCEPGLTTGDVMQNQSMRVIAFRALLRDFPGYDPTTLWLHSYDVEVELIDVDPTNVNGQTPAPPSADIGASGPTT